jgi:hypothetical protein
MEQRLTHRRIPYLETIHGIMILEGRYTHEITLASQLTSLRLMLKVSAAAKERKKKDG